MSMCRVFSGVVGRGCLLWQCIFLAKLYKSLPCFILHSKAKFACYSRCFLNSYFCIPVPCNEKDIFFWVLVLKGLVGLHRTVQILQRYWLEHRLELLWYWMVCLGNEQKWFCPFWDCIQVCVFDPFVDHDGYSIYSKGFLPTKTGIASKNTCASFYHEPRIAPNLNHMI